MRFLKRKSARYALVLVAGALAAPAPAGAYVYWDNYGTDTVARANNDGTGANLNFIGAGHHPVGVAVDGSHIFWADQASTSIAVANIDGTNPQQGLVSNTHDPYQMVRDGPYLYWASYQGGSSIARLQLEGGSEFKQDFIPGAGAPIGLAVDGSHIYWSDIGTNTIKRADMDGSNIVPDFITGANNPSGLAVDGAHIYWTNTNSGTIGRANLDGGGVTQDFITGADGPFGLAVDAAHLYWANSHGTTIGRANLDGSGVNQSFIAGASSPIGLAVDQIGVTLPDTTSPIISNAKFASSSFKAKKGTKLKLKLSEPGTVAVVVTQRVKGRMVGGKCVRNAKKGKKCTLTVKKATLSYAGKAGPNSFTFRLPALKRGTYAAAIRARDASGNVSTPRTLTFKIT